MKNSEVLLKDILKLKHDLEKQDMRLPPGLAGMYGEIIVFQKISKLFKTPKYLVSLYSGQKGADIEIAKGKEKINIEVKTSRLKEEGFGEWYGVALNTKKCRKHNKKDFCYFDYVTFVVLDKNFKDPKLYVIPRIFIENREKLLRNTHTRFKSATHRLIISNDGNMPRLSKVQHKLIKDTEKFKDRWDQIR